MTAILSHIQNVGNDIKNKFGIPDDWNPKQAVGIVLGSGLGDWVDTSSHDFSKVKYSNISCFPKVGADGHAGYFCFARKIGDVPVFVMQGRQHYYEGHSMEDVVLGVRVMAKCLGVTHLILTNAAGAINPQFSPGDLVFITDHINHNLPNPLSGWNDPSLGTRFPDMSEVYDLRWRVNSHRMALKFPQQVHLSGVYLGTSGPSYETPAEIRAFASMGADLVGMSTVPEAIAARHAGIKHILGISCVTNLAAGLGLCLLDHAEVREQANRVKEPFGKILTAIIEAPLP